MDTDAGVIDVTRLRVAEVTVSDSIKVPDSNNRKIAS